MQMLMQRLSVSSLQSPAVTELVVLLCGAYLTTGMMGLLLTLARLSMGRRF